MKRLMPLVGLLLLATGMPAAAQVCTAMGNSETCELDVELRLPVPPVMKMTLQGGSLDLGRITNLDLERGYADYTGPDIRVQSNVPFMVGLEAPAFFTYHGPGGLVQKSVESVWWGKHPGTYPNQLTPLTQTVMAGEPGPARGRVPQASQLYFRVYWNRATDPPGRYQLDLRLTLSTP